MTKIVRVEFKYFDRSTCSRCKTTDKNVAKTVRNLREALAEEGVKVELKTTKLPASKLAQSNSVFINNIDVEKLANEKKNARTTACRGCGELLRGPCDCRAYTYRGKKYGHIPRAMIREAIRKVIGKKPTSSKHMHKSA